MQPALTRKFDQYLTVHENGHLLFDGWDTVELANQYGTPLFVYSERAIRDNFRALHSAFEKSGYPKYHIAFGSKANPNLAIIKILQLEGCYIDFVGPGEMYAALKAGVDPSHLIFNGNNKSEDQLADAIEVGVGYVNVDCYDELNIINTIAGKLGKIAKVNIRLKLGYREQSKWDPVLAVKLRKRKFGIDVPSGVALRTVKKALQLKNVRLVGFSHHVGWSYGEPDNSSEAHLRRFKNWAEEVVEFMSLVKKELEFEASLLDFGGGLSVARREGYGLKRQTTRSPSVDEYVRTHTSTVTEKCEQYNLEKPTICTETGRYMVQNAGILLSRVGRVKEDPQGKWVGIDASTSDLIYILTHNFYYHIVSANKLNVEQRETVDIVGPICGAYDVLSGGLEIQKLEAGDLVAIFDVGAYCESKLCRFGARPWPASVLMSEAGPEIIRKRETVQDMYSTQEIPKRLFEM